MSPWISSDEVQCRLLVVVGLLHSKEIGRICCVAKEATVETAKPMHDDRFVLERVLGFNPMLEIFKDLVDTRLSGGWFRR